MTFFGRLESIFYLGGWNMKKFIFLFAMLCGFLFLQDVQAGTLSWQNSKRLSPNSFELYLEATDLDLNYLSGTWEVTNGKITKIVMEDGWVNSSGLANTFYYYRNGVQSGSYRIATITIELTSDSTTKMHNTDIGVKRCVKDFQNNFFNKTGNLVSESEYTRVCFSDDATLRNLYISNGVLSPQFQSNVDQYSATVDYSVEQVRFTPVLNHEKARVVFGTICPLKVGLNTCQIIVEAENKTQKTYTVFVTRKQNEEKPTLSSDATLKDLTLNVGALNPNFQSNILQYSTKVPNETTELMFYPIVNHEKAKVVSDKICKLSVGMNTCQIIVEAEDQTRATYYIFVEREKESNPNPTPSDDATLKELKLSSGELSPLFQPNIFQYSAIVSYDVEFVIFAPIVNHEKAKVVNDKTCRLEVGSNTCSIIVEAEDGNRKTYQIQITREKYQEEANDENDTSIRDFSIQNGNLTEPFDSSKKEYTIEIEQGTEIIVFEYILNANNHHYTIPYEIDNQKPYYDLVITSINGQKQDTYRFFIKVRSNENGNQEEDVKPSNPDYPFIDNPQTGDNLSMVPILFLIGGSVLGILFVSKKNKIQKI